MAIIQLNDITFVRGETAILTGVSWKIEPGEHWALLGANGSGKTTLLKIVTGYEWPTAGTVSVLGQQYGHCDIRELRKAIGWVSAAIEQRLPARDTALEVTVSGIEASIGLFRDVRKKEWQAAHHALDLVGMNAFAERPFGLLSQGEQQRVLIARAMVNRPRLLILDEPCAGLDPTAREELLSHLDLLSRQHDAPTMILVTHHIEEIHPCISHVMLLRNGRMLEQGRTADVLTTDQLSRAFAGAWSVQHRDGRFYLRPASEG
jgi:iron complex transport system ATP-binding protein